MTALLQRDRRRSRYLFDLRPSWCLERNALDALSGQAATFSRASIATAIGSDGRVQRCAYAQPRFTWTDLDGDGIRESSSLLLEDTRTNLVIQSDALATGWSVAGSAAATNAVATYAGRPFSRVTGTSGAQVFRAVTLTANGTKALSILIRSDGVAGIGYCELYDATADVGRGILRYVIASDGSMTATCTTGTLLAIDALADGVYRFLVSAPSCVAANTHFAIAYTFASDATLTTVLLGGVQVENAAFPSSLIPTGTATVTRAADALAYAFLTPPERMTVYVKFRERGSAMSGLAGIMAISNSGLSSPDFFLGADNSGGYRVVNDPVVSDGGGSIPFGALVEVRGVLSADGSVQFGQSLNGGTESVASASGANALASAWSGPTLFVNSLGLSSNVGYLGLHALRIAAGVQTMAFMREG